MKLKWWVGNLDGRNQGLVVETSKEKARKISHTGLADFNNYWSEERGPIPVWAKIGVLYKRSFDYRFNQDDPRNGWKS